MDRYNSRRLSPKWHTSAPKKATDRDLQVLRWEVLFRSHLEVFNPYSKVIHSRYRPEQVLGVPGG
jgi:hypothetical protein